MTTMGPRREGEVEEFPIPSRFCRGREGERKRGKEGERESGREGEVEVEVFFW